MNSVFGQKSKSPILAIIALCVMAIGNTACHGLFRERGGNTPVPTDAATSKSFFVNSKGTPKTFLCAWAPEMSRGSMGEAHLTMLYNHAQHCNIEFDVTERYLVGKMVHPSFPNDRNRWKEVVKIPIRKHYSREKDSDEFGREKNDVIDNSDRDHWSARPQMELDLAGLQFNDFIPGANVTSVEDIEWDKDRNFLGFTANTTFLASYFGSEFQGSIRVNFLEFKHDPTFKKTPFHQSNSRLMNILHVLGRKVDGVEPDLYAAHWDIRKPNVIVLNGVPQEHQKTVSRAVEHWNEALWEIGALPKGQKAFVPQVRELKHAFDLRYPTINWVSDRRLAQSAPLGIGMAHTDMRNGKIIWGGVALWGGELERYVNAYTSSESSGGNAQASASIPAYQQLMSYVPMQLPSMKGLDKLNIGMTHDLSRFMAIQQSDQLAKEIKSSVDQLASSKGRMSSEQLELAQNHIASMREKLQKFQETSPQLATIVADAIGIAQDEANKVSEFFKRSSIHEQMGANVSTAIRSAGSNAAIQAERNGEKDLARLMKESNSAKRKEMLENLTAKQSPFTVESELTVANMAPGWMAGAAASKRSYPEMLESVVMHLALHEWGHVMGLGHQFKENIVPEEGTAPSKLIEQLRKEATEEAGFINATSVMGYRHGRVEVIEPAESLGAGPHDKLVLRYLYKQEYTTFDKEKDAYAFFKVPESGKIPSVTRTQDGRTLPAGYFQQCNDYEASLGADPFCNRWDRGSTAEEIVKSYFGNISDNLLASLYSLVGTSSDPHMAEGRLWGSALDTFSRVRLFYDEMRRRLRTDEQLKPLWDELRSDKDALFDFSKACHEEQPENITNPTLKKIMARKDIRDLCRANALALREFKFFLNLPEGDFTRIDHTNKYVAGGFLEGDVTRNMGNMIGTWYQLANFPLKYSAMYTFLNSNAYMMWDGWLVPNFYYDYAENRFLYRTLYPREYTQLIADSVQNNLRFAASGKDDNTTMGRTALYTGIMLPMQDYGTNDVARLPREFNELLEQQTQFRLSMVAVMIEPMKPDAKLNVKADHYKKFTGKIFDFATGAETTTRDVFVLPGGDVFVWANGMFIYPVSKMKFYKETSSYVIAYKVDYDKNGQKLLSDSVKAKLMELHNTIAGYCVDGVGGTNNGLAPYFDSNTVGFAGFQIPPGIAEEKGTEKMQIFLDSIETEFGKYEAEKGSKIPQGYPIRTMRRVCDEAIRGVGQVSATAALLNGYWLSITYPYLVK